MPAGLRAGRARPHLDQHRPRYAALDRLKPPSPPGPTPHTPPYPPPNPFTYTRIPSTALVGETLEAGGAITGARVVDKSKNRRPEYRLEVWTRSKVRGGSCVYVCWDAWVRVGGCGL